MSYRLSVDSFDSTFAVKEDGSKLTHFSGKRFKLFPFIANNNSAPIYDLDTIVGRYISQIEKISPEKLTVDDLTEKLKEDTSIDVGMDELFHQVIKHMFFDKEGKIRPINLRMIAQIPCEESSACKIADYLVDVLGDESILRASIKRASAKLDEQSNVLEKFAMSKLASKPLSQTTVLPYQRITRAVQRKFESDFEYILGARNRTRDYLIPLLEFYYFTYTAQAIMQLNRFMSGEREHCVALYGLDHHHRIPHLLPSVAVVLHIDLLDGVNVGPVDVADHSLRPVVDLVAHLHGREDDIHFARPQFKEQFGIRRILKEIIVGLFRQ